LKTAEHQILTRIGFAERWLRRAREECLDGDVARGLLTLVLADAEVRRVLQLAVAPAPAPRSRSRLLPVVAVGAGLVIAAAMALQLGVLAPGAATVESVGLAPGLLLRPGTGALLQPLEASGPQEPVRSVSAPTMPEPAQPVTAKRGSVRQGVVAAPPGAQQAASPIPVTQPDPSPVPVASPPPPAPTPVPAVAPAPAPTAALSGVDLLDLVIVADRTLRRSQP
jgi:hypothetical protein